MAIKKIDAPIESIETPWEGYMGPRVEAFIKSQLKGKAGVFKYDTDNNRYMVFADAADMDRYLADPTNNAHLLIGVFDAPFNYTATIGLLTPSYTATLLGEAVAPVRYTFDVVNKSGQSVGEDVSVRYTLTRGATKYTKTERLRYGSTAEFDPSEWLGAGTSTLTIAITGINTLAATTVAVTIQVVDLKLSDRLDISKSVEVSATSAPVQIPYTLSGYGTKVMEWYIDGEKVPEVRVEDEVTQSSTTRTKTLNLKNFAAGTHSLQYRARTEIDGQVFYSPTLYREVMLTSPTYRTDQVAVALQQPSGTPIILPTDTLEVRGLVQYEDASLTYAAYSPTNKPVEVTVKLGSEVVSRSSVTNGNLRRVGFTPTTSGALTLEITAPGITRTFSAPVEQTATGLHAVTNQLLLAVDAKGRANTDSYRASWDGNGLTATMQGFKWNSQSGWNDNALNVPAGSSVEWNVAPLASDVTASGMTLEVELAASNVSDDDAVLMDLLSDSGAGIKITASQAILTSNISNAAATASTRFKAGEFVRLAFVIRPTSGETFARLASVYVDGIHSASFGYGFASGPFVCPKTLKFAPTNGGGVKIRSLRLYGTALSDEDVLNNFELYRPTTSETQAVVRRNNLLAAGSDDFDTNAMLAHTPVMIVTGNVPTLEATTNKKDTIVVDVEYTDLEDPTRSFSMTDAVLGGQGTSSMLYPRKNFRLYTKKSDQTKVYDADGNIVEDRLLSFHGNAIPVQTWCLKADYAESSSTHNTGIARLWNAAMYNAVINVDGTPTYPLRTKAQEAARKNNYPYDVRTAVDGFPIVMFYRLTKDSPLVFLGKYNFNNDKSTENVFGFRDIPGFDNSKVECWECLDNAHPLALMSQYSSQRWTAQWSAAFEGRYPDGNENTAALKKLVAYVAETMRPTYASIAEAFDVPKLLAYYVYAMRFGAVDQLVKNTMLTTEDGQHWYFINYDNDTVNGLDNDGIISFLPNIDRQSVDPRIASSYCYAGHDSKLWNIVEQAIENDPQVLQTLKDVDQALYVAGLKYAGVIDMFENRQSSKWPEIVYNRDARYKYLMPWLEGLDHLPKLQGSRKTHRRWWLSKRFSLFDSKWVTGDFRASVISFKCYDAPANTDFSITSGRDLFFGFGINNVVKASGVRLAVGESHTFTVEDALPIGNPVMVYAAPDIRGIDLSNFYPYLADVNLQGANNAELGTSLTSLILGREVSGAKNQTLTAVSGLASMVRLENLDLQNLAGISSLDLSELVNLRAANLSGTTISAAKFSEGCPLQDITLPSTCASLELSGHSDLEFSAVKFEGNSMANLRSLTIKGCEKMKNSWGTVKSWVEAVNNAAPLELRLEDVAWKNLSATDFLEILNALGEFEITGTASLTSCTIEQARAIQAILGEDCFDGGAAFQVSAPLMIVAPESVGGVAGTSVKMPVRITPSDTDGRWELSCATSGITFNNGQLYCYPDKGVASGDYPVTVTFIPRNGGSLTTTVTLRVQSLTELTGIYVNGDALAVGNSCELTAQITPSTCNAPISVEWRIIEGAGKISTPTNGGCTVTVADGVKKVRVRATATDTSTRKGFEAERDVWFCKADDCIVLRGRQQTSTLGDAFYVNFKEGGLVRPARYDVISTDGTVTKHIRNSDDDGQNPRVDFMMLYPIAEGDTIKVYPASELSDVYINTSCIVSADFSKMSQAESIFVLPSIHFQSFTPPTDCSHLQRLYIGGSVSAFDVRDMPLLRELSTPSTLASFKWSSSGAPNFDGYKFAEGHEITDEILLEGIDVKTEYLTDVARFADITAANVTGKISVLGATSSEKAKVAARFPNLEVTCAKELPENEVPVTIELDFTATNPAHGVDTGVKVNVYGKEGRPLTVGISWGDGTSDVAKGDTDYLYWAAHTYATGRKYTLSVTGVKYARQISIVKGSLDYNLNLPAVRAISAGSTAANVQIPAAVNPVTVEADFFRYSACADFSSCFNGCSGLTAIPEGLFSDCTAASNFSYCFQNCSGLTAIPEGLFSSCPAATSFSSCFNYCPGLTSIPEGLFSSCPAATSFSYCFQNCTGLTAIPEGLFSNCTAANNFNGCFRRCSSLTTAYFPKSYSTATYVNLMEMFASVGSGCTVYVTQTTPPSISSNTISTGVVGIHVPTASVEAYKAATNWSAFAAKIVGDSSLD